MPTWKPKFARAASYRCQPVPGRCHQCAALAGGSDGVPSGRNCKLCARACWCSSTCQDEDLMRHTAVCPMLQQSSLLHEAMTRDQVPSQGSLASRSITKRIDSAFVQARCGK
eukprot:5435699-Pleurochrysis_carterae.AAC.2